MCVLNVASADLRKIKSNGPNFAKTYFDVDQTVRAMLYIDCVPKHEEFRFRTFKSGLFFPFLFGFVKSRFREYYIHGKCLDLWDIT